jgi:peptidoglycan hydrolase CwlO-like protein
MENVEDKFSILDEATKTIHSLIEKIQSLQKENDSLKSEIKRLQWSLHEQD